jgi:phage portal protein BeeE
MINIENEKDVEGVFKEVGIDRLASAGIASTGNIAPTKKTSEYLKASVGWVHACVNAIADEIGQIQIKLYKAGKKEATEILEHPALDLLYKCNSFTTKFDFFSTVAQYLELTGEAPFYVSFVNGKPDSMIVVATSMS